MPRPEVRRLLSWSGERGRLELLARPVTSLPEVTGCGLPGPRPAEAGGGVAARPVLPLKYDLIPACNE